MDYGKVAYIGGGNMARALAGGMLAAGYEAAHLWIAEPLPEQRAVLTDELPGTVVIDNNEGAARDAECIVLAVKPQILAEVCKPLAPIAQSSRPLVISIAAGVRARDIESWLGGNLPVVRVMPNQTCSAARRPTSFRRQDRSSMSPARMTSIRLPRYRARARPTSTCSSICSLKRPLISGFHTRMH